MRRAFLALFALIPVLGCSTTFSQRTTLLERREDDARPGFVRDVHVRLVQGEPGVTRAEISSLGRCAHVEEWLVRDAHVATTRAHPTVVVVATAYATAVGAGSGDTPITAIGGALLVGGAVLTTLLLVGPEKEDDVHEHRERRVLGVRACDRRPAPGVLVYATTLEGEVIAETDAAGVARLPVDRAQIVSLSLLGLVWQKGAAPAGSPGSGGIGEDDGRGRPQGSEGRARPEDRRRPHLFFNEPPPAKSPPPVHESVCTESVTLLQSGEKVVK